MMPWFIKVWGLAVGVVLGIFYAVRGIWLLLRQVFKSRRKTRASSTRAGTETAAVNRSAATHTEPPITPAGASKAKAAADATAATPDAVTPKARATRKKKAAARSKQVKKKVATSKPGAKKTASRRKAKHDEPGSQAPESDERHADGPNARVKAAPASPRATASPTVKSPVKVAPRPRRKQAPENAVQTGTETSANTARTQASKAIQDVVTKSKAETSVVQKRMGGRRGIRLKSLDEAADDELG